MRQVLFVLFLLLNVTLAEATLQRATNFTSNDAGEYSLQSVSIYSDNELIVMEKQSNGNWCVDYAGESICQNSGLSLILSINTSGMMSVITSSGIDDIDISDKDSIYNNMDGIDFTFSKEGLSLYSSDQDGDVTMFFVKTGATSPTTSTNSEAQTTYTKELQEETYGSTAHKAKVQEIKTELLATTASSVDEIADGNGLLVTYKDGSSGLIYSAPEGTKGGSGNTFFTASNLKEKLSILQHAATRSSNKKVLAIAAQYWDWGYNDDVPQLANMLSANGFDVTYKHYDNREAGIMSDFQNWGDYAIVLISTHGVARDTKSRTTNSINMAIDLNIAPDDTSVSTTDLNSKRLIEWDNCTTDGTCHKSLLATNLFFEEYLSALPNTLVYVSACHVGKNDAMAEVLFDKGAQTMIGYSDLVQVSFAKEQGINIFTRLVGDESIENIFSLPTNSDLTTGYHTGIKEKDATPAEIVVFQKEAINYEALLASKTYDIAGGFASHDFAGVDKAFDWVFKTTSGSVFQLQGNEPTDKDVFGWKKVTGITDLSPAWYMFPLGSDVDGDGGVLFDWIFIGASSQAVYKLAGVSAQGTFKYSEAINLKYTISGNKVTFSK